jgi:hypothetical protein
MGKMQQDMRKLGMPSMKLRGKLFGGNEKKMPPPGFTKFVAPEGEGPQRLGNRPKNRKYPSKARTPLGG